MRGIIRFLLGLVIVLAIVWLGLWWYAEGRMESGFTAWADQMTGQGWKIGYGSDKRGTSPLAATLNLTNLTMTAPADQQGRSASVTLPSLALRVQAFNPLVLHTDLPNKILVSLGPQIDAAVTFGSISDSQIIDPHLLFTHQKLPFSSNDVRAANIDILASEGSLLVLHIDGFSGHAAVNRTASADNTAFALTEDFDGLAVSPLMTRMLSIPFGGKISHFGLGLNVSGPLPPGLPDLAAQLESHEADLAAQEKLLAPVLHKWAQAGGNGNVNINLVVGPSTAAADAAVKFDANAQPAGTANVTANHLDQLTAVIGNAYPGTQDSIAQAEAQLSQYLSTTTQGGQTLTAHVAYGNGAVNVNGQKVGDLPPVNWNALENPPPPPVDAMPAAGDDGSGAAPAP